MAQNKKAQEILNKEGSKSSKMIALYDAGMEIRDIAKAMDTNYHFVYNVVSNHCRKNGIEVRVTSKQGTVKASIIALLEQGKTNTEISAALSKDYNYVFKVRKEWEASRA